MMQRDESFSDGCSFDESLYLVQNFCRRWHLRNAVFFLHFYETLLCDVLCVISAVLRNFCCSATLFLFCDVFFAVLRRFFLLFCDVIYYIFAVLRHFYRNYAALIKMKKKTRKTTPIRRVAARETVGALGVRRARLKEPLKPLEPSHHSIVLRRLRGASFGPPLCRETLASLITNAHFFPIESRVRIITEIAVSSWNLGIYAEFSYRKYLNFNGKIQFRSIRIYIISN